MPKMVVLKSFKTGRDGKIVQPPIGSVFDFTEEEMDSVRKHGLARRAVNETAEVDPETIEVAEVEARTAAKKAKASKAEVTADDI